jgi:signal transduction histidine kinase
VDLPAAELPEGHEVLDWLAQQERPLVLGDSVASGADGWSYLAIPLMAAGELVGVLQLEGERPGVFAERELNLLTAVGAHLAGALVRERLRLHVQELSAWKERAVQAREIQEAAGRMLATAAIKLNAGDMLVEVDPRQAVQELRHARELAVGSLQQLRHGAMMLDPSTETSIPALEAGTTTGA